MRKLEEKERLLQGTISAAERELGLRTQALDMNKRKVTHQSVTVFTAVELGGEPWINKDNRCHFPGSGLCAAVRGGANSAGAGSAEAHPGPRGGRREQHL